MHRTVPVEAFLDWEDRQPTRFEFDGLRIFAMTGGSAAQFSDLYIGVELMADLPAAGGA